MRSTAYQKDFAMWAHTQASALRKGDYGNLDIANLAEEIESLGKSEKRMLGNYLKVLLLHKLKIKYQPEKHTRSWDLSVKEATIQVQQTLKDNPSLKSKLTSVLRDAYKVARVAASRETGLDEEIFPEECEFEKELNIK